MLYSSTKYMEEIDMNKRKPERQKVRKSLFPAFETE